MGRYDYQCSECDHSFEARHSAKIVLTNCPQCKKEALQKVMNIPRVNSGVKKSAVVGSVVKKTIDDMKKDIAEEKKKLKNRRKK